MTFPKLNFRRGSTYVSLKLTVIAAVQLASGCGTAQLSDLEAIEKLDRIETTCRQDITAIFVDWPPPDLADWPEDKRMLRKADNQLAMSKAMGRAAAAARDLNVSVSMKDLKDRYLNLFETLEAAHLKNSQDMRRLDKEAARVSRVETGRLIDLGNRRVINGIEELAKQRPDLKPRLDKMLEHFMNVPDVGQDRTR